MLAAWVWVGHPSDGRKLRNGGRGTGPLRTVPSAFPMRPAQRGVAVEKGKKKKSERKGDKKKKRKARGQHHAPGNALLKHQLLSHGLAEDDRPSAAPPALQGSAQHRRLAPADLSSSQPCARSAPRMRPHSSAGSEAGREGGGEAGREGGKEVARVRFELISAVNGSNNKITALGSSGPAERRGTRANGAGSSRGGGLENSTKSSFETQLPDPFCRCSGASS